MNRRLNTGVLALVSCFVALQCTNRMRDQTSTSSLSDEYKTMDTNGDGRLSTEEYGTREPSFSSMDTDGNGYLTAAELSKRGS